MNNTEGKIPVKRDGGLWFTVPYPNQKNLVWEDPSEFEAVMELVSYQKTVKGSFYLWADQDTNATYPMIVEEFAKLPEAVIGSDKPVEAAWTFVQYDDKYSLSYLEEV
jgi:hypothetical protein